MADYTNTLNLYKPNRNDKIAVDQSLAENFQKIENTLGGSFSGFNTLAERLNDIVSQITNKAPIDALKRPGIKGDGVNSDSAGIQSLFDLSNTQGGVSIYFDEGVYRLTSELIIRKNTRVEAHPNAVFQKDHDGTLLKNIEPNDTFTGYGGNGRIAIYGGRWDADAPNHSGGTPFVFAHADYIYLKDLVILDVDPGHAIELNASKRVFMDSLSFYGMKNVAGKEYSEAIQLDLMKSQGAFPWKNGYFDHTPCENITITNCVFGPSGSNGAWGRGVGSHSATIGRWHENIIVTGNVMKDCLHWGIRGYSWKNVVVSNNTLLNCGGGISMNTPDPNDTEDSKDVNGTVTGSSQLCKNFMITNNKVLGGGSYGSGITVSGESGGDIELATVMGNTLEDCNGMTLTRLKDYIIANNILKTIEGSGFSCNYTYQGVITGNVVNNTSTNGLTMTSTNNVFVTISNNSFNFIGNHGMWFAGADIDSITVSGNTFVAIGATSAGTAWNGIRITTNCDRINVNGNTFRNYGGSYAMQYAVYASSSNTNILIASNNAAGIPISASAHTLFGNLSS